MSASIHWRLITKDPGRIDGVWTPSAFVEAMNRAFGVSPWRLSAEHLSTLEGMAATEPVYRNSTPATNGYQQIINAITNEDGTYNTIEVWPEY